MKEKLVVVIDRVNYVLAKNFRSTKRHIFEKGLDFSKNSDRERSPKNSERKTKKFVKLIGHTYDCSSLTNFEYEVNEMTGNRSYVNLLKLGRKNS